MKDSFVWSFSDFYYYYLPSITGSMEVFETMHFHSDTGTVIVAYYSDHWIKNVK